MRDDGIEVLVKSCNGKMSLLAYANIFRAANDGCSDEMEKTCPEIRFQLTDFKDFLERLR
jgi:hypothetical protein